MRTRTAAVAAGDDDWRQLSRLRAMVAVVGYTAPCARRSDRVRGTAPQCPMPCRPRTAVPARAASRASKRAGGGGGPSKHVGVPRRLSTLPPSVGPRVPGENFAGFRPANTTVVGRPSQPSGRSRSSGAVMVGTTASPVSADAMRCSCRKASRRHRRPGPRSGSDGLAGGPTRWGVNFGAPASDVGRVLSRIAAWRAGNELIAPT